MADRLGVSEDVYAGWEADERPMPSGSFTRLIRLLSSGQRTEYVRTVFVPLMEAQKVKADLPDLTHSVPSGDPP